jgi:hypothetical protein
VAGRSTTGYQASRGPGAAKQTPQILSLHLHAADHDQVGPLQIVVHHIFKRAIDPIYDCLRRRAGRVGCS